MAPEIERIKALGFTALVECSAVGVGRRADIDRAVSEATGVPRPYTYLSMVFLPKLEASGVDRSTIEKLMQDNPLRAYAR